MMSYLRPWIAVGCVVVSASWVTAAFLQEDPFKDAESQVKPERYREGTRLQKTLGWFKVAVDRVEFHPSDGNPPLIVLENLALERVVDELAGDLVLIWHVDGEITEYHGRNYLLLDRAFVRSARDRQPTSGSIPE